MPLRKKSLSKSQERGRVPHPTDKAGARAMVLAVVRLHLGRVAKHIGVSRSHRRQRRETAAQHPFDCSLQAVTCEQPLLAHMQPMPQQHDDSRSSGSWPCPGRIKSDNHPVHDPRAACRFCKPIDGSGIRQPRKARRNALHYMSVGSGVVLAPSVPESTTPFRCLVYQQPSRNYSQGASTAVLRLLSISRSQPLC